AHALPRWTHHRPGRVPPDGTGGAHLDLYQLRNRAGRVRARGVRWGQYQERAELYVRRAGGVDLVRYEPGARAEKEGCGEPVRGGARRAAGAGDAHGEQRGSAGERHHPGNPRHPEHHAHPVRVPDGPGRHVPGACRAAGSAGPPDRGCAPAVERGGLRRGCLQRRKRPGAGEGSRHHHHPGGGRRAQRVRPPDGPAPSL
ncbi:MAG: hypothetical protein AVDCRST_MAG68-2616, partial [uncultured Gemmatimonadetes bacterium]